MKTRPLFKFAYKRATYILVFMLAIFSANAQCPTIPNQTPPPICDASGFTFNDLNAFATDQGNGIVWYDSLTGGSPFNMNQLVSEGIYYADDNSGACGTRTSITVDFVVDPINQSLDGIYCSNENATVQTYIDDVLQSNIPSGGSVSVFYDLDLMNQANTTDTIPLGATNYFIVFIDNSGCESQIELGSTAIFNAPADPTPADPQDFCSDTNSTIGDLDTGTTDSVNWYANIDGNGDPILPALSLTTPLVDGSTYYVQTISVFCGSNPVPVSVNIFDSVDAGTPGNLEYCEDSIPTTDFDLFNELGGTPDITGIWTGPLTTTNGHLGTINISTLTTPNAYVFTYTVPANGACPEANSIVIIEIYDTFTSGTPSGANPASFCEAALPVAFDLSTLLDNEDPNGQWTQGTASTDPVVSSPIDLTAFTPGMYNFTYTQNVLPNPCPEESTTVQVIVLQDPEAGNAINAVFCENDIASNSPYDLFNTLDGSQDNNSGVWTDASATPVTSPIDITVLTVAGSPYQYTYTIDNGTCSDFEDITITIEPAPESGTVNGTADFCEGVAPATYDLFDLLDGEDQVGTWYLGTDNTGMTITNPVDLSVLTSGNYSYTYDVDAIGTCDDPLVTVQVNINALPNTGIATPAIFCENDLATNSPLDLFGQLAGNATGGIWTDDNTSGALTGNNVDLTLLTIGSYNFTYSITDGNTCTNSSTVTVTVEDAPESGNALAPVVFCENDLATNSPFDLFTLLDGTQDTNGTWSDINGVVTNPVDISGLTDGAYDYTYSVPDIGTCSDVDVVVQIIVNQLPSTGTATPAVFCENDLVANSPLDLFGQLAGNDVGGTWTDDDATGALTGNNVDLTLLTVGSYNFTYSITDVNTCVNNSTVTLTIEEAPNAGIVNGTPEFCVSEITTGQTVDLFNFLDNEDQTGVWSDNTPSSQLAGNIVTIDGLTPGTYTFTFDVDAIGACDDPNMPTVSIIINDTAVPTATAIQEFCDAATVADLSATGTTIQWYDDLLGGTALPATTVLVDGETYYASQTNTATGCESFDRVEVTAVIIPLPNAGGLATPIIVCNNTTVDLNTGLDGTQDTTGAWYEGTDATGVVVTNPLMYDVTGFTIGDYQFTYVVSATPCPDASITITVSVQAPLNAGTNGTIDICNFDDGTTYDLFTQLGGTPDAGGTWVPELASTTGIFDPSVDAAGTYTYFLTNSCGNATSEVVVTVTDTPDAGTDGAFIICAAEIDTTNNMLDLLTVLNDTPGTAGTFTNDDGATGFSGTMLDLSMVAPGTYNFTYFVAAVMPCTVNASAVATVTVNDTLPVTVVNATLDFCLADTPTVADLDASVTGITITWYADATATTALDASEALVDGEDYFATQTDATTGCESSSREQVTVNIDDAATPTLIDTNQELCINDVPTINDLTLNIVEFNSATNNIVWYDAETNGTVISNTTALIANTTYYASLIDASGCESSVRLAVNPDLTGCGLLATPDGFSPNGDGVNDTYDIENIAIIYPNFEMEIFNRYGNIVYKGNASTPSFDGTSNQSRSIGSGKLPVGVYYYILNYNDGVNKPKQGRLYLSR